MNTVPNSITIGRAFGFIGGIISIAFMAWAFEPSESTIEVVGMYLLFAVLFFALAGACRANGPWNWKMLTLMLFLIIGLSAVTMLGEYIGTVEGSVFIVIAVLVLIGTSMPSAKMWLDENKA